MVKLSHLNKTESDLFNIVKQILVKVTKKLMKKSINDKISVDK